MYMMYMPYDLILPNCRASWFLAVATYHNSWKEAAVHLASAFQTKAQRYNMHQNFNKKTSPYTRNWFKQKHTFNMDLSNKSRNAHIKWQVQRVYMMQSVLGARENYHPSRTLARWCLKPSKGNNLENPVVYISFQMMAASCSKTLHSPNWTYILGKKKQSSKVLYSNFLPYPQKYWKEPSITSSQNVAYSTIWAVTKILLYRGLHYPVV